MAYKVAVLGGGVAGLSAAHELVERGFSVDVFETKPVLGGKARSIPVNGSGLGGRRDLPGEHGFRFFPGFYKHVTDTMRRIPLPGGGAAYDNLTVATRILLARSGQVEITTLAGWPKNLEDLRVLLCQLFTPLGIPLDEVTFFVNRLLILATSCAERRLAEFENLKWWEFIAADRMSATYQRYLGQGLTRSLVAMRAQESSTRTVGYILLQLLYTVIFPDQVFDRLLNGPTNDVWLNPWIEYLRSRGVNFHTSVQVQGFALAGGRVAAVNAVSNGQPTGITADYYIAAMPVEVMSALVSAEMKAAAPSIANLDRLQTRWMNGIQFYLRHDVPLARGHAIYLDSPWALTSVSQHQFWMGVDLSSFGDGAVGGILSVDISEWQEPGILYGKPAIECTAEQIKDEVWAQLQHHLNVEGTVLDDSNLAAWFLDPDVQFPNPTLVTNLEPLMINTAGSLQYRPDAQIEIPNLFLASDYVRGYTDLATMEGANEAARRAVNCLLAATGSTAQAANLWPFAEPDFLRPLQEIDRIRFNLGRDHHLL
jgi:uncharacterized protein with NAD-binding domain and iron-sulfur cluster